MTKKCIMPWMHMQVNSDGNVRPCCNAAKYTPPLGNVLTENIVEVWNNERYQTLRKQMLNGEEPEDCKPCYNSERLGLFSKRLRENEDWQHLSHLMTAEKAEFKIRHLDVRFDNVCNFKCRYCNPWVSHSWYNDYKKLNIPISKEQAIDVNGADLLTIIKDNVLDDLESVFFCGGEPLLMDQHLELLQLLDQKQKYDTKLLYISNLSKLNYRGVDYIEMWKKFKNVNLHFSMDTFGNKLEYIRCGANWDKIEENIKRVFSHKELLRPKMSITVTMFNAPYILEMVEYIVGKGYANYDDIPLHIVRNPHIYSCQILPREVKEKITTEVAEFLTRVELPHFYKSRYEYFVNYMNEVDTYEQHKDEFITMTKQLDEVREEDFASVFPELGKYYE